MACRQALATVLTSIVNDVWLMMTVNDEAAAANECCLDDRMALEEEIFLGRAGLPPIVTKGGPAPGAEIVPTATHWACHRRSSASDHEKERKINK